MLRDISYAVSPAPTFCALPIALQAGCAASMRLSRAPMRCVSRSAGRWPCRRDGDAMVSGVAVQDSRRRLCSCRQEGEIFAAL